MNIGLSSQKCIFTFLKRSYNFNMDMSLIVSSAGSGIFISQELWVIVWAKTVIVHDFLGFGALKCPKCITFSKLFIPIMIGFEAKKKYYLYFGPDQGQRGHEQEVGNKFIQYLSNMGIKSCQITSAIQFDPSVYQDNKFLALQGTQ